MNTWYEVKVKYSKINEKGKERIVSEPYLVDAVSFTEAESRINKEMEPYISGEFRITAMKIANYSEIIPSEIGDRWFKAKITFIAIDEERGVERKTNTYLLIQANETNEIVGIVQKAFEGSVSDYEIPMIIETPIVEVFNYIE